MRMNGLHKSGRNIFKAMLLGTTIAGGAIQPAMAQDVAGDMDVYLLQFGSEFADGTQVLSHSQEALMARSFYDARSQVMLDFRNGAVTIADASGTNASAFSSLTPTEVNYGFDYDSGTLLGESTFFPFYNDTIRGQIGNGVPLGQSGEWQIEVPASTLNLPIGAAGSIPVTVSRSYTSHNGQDVAIIEFDIAAFEYDLASGEDVIQWGKGVAVTDDKFGTIHAVATHHRALVMQPDGTMRPMSMKTTAYAKNTDGTWRFDFAGFDAVEDAMARVAAGTEGYVHTIDFSGNDVEVDQTPFDVANSLQLIAMASGELSANGLAGDIQAYLTGGPQDPMTAALEDTGSWSGAVNTFLNAYVEQNGPVMDANAVKGAATYVMEELEFRANRAVETYTRQRGTTKILRDNAVSDVRWYTKEIAKLNVDGEDYSHLMAGYEEAKDRLSTLDMSLVQQDVELEMAGRKYQTALQDYEKLADNVPTSGSKFASTLNKMSEMVPESIKKLGNGSLSALDKYGKANSVWTIGKAGYNATQDTSSGKINLTRSYSDRPQGDRTFTEMMLQEPYYAMKDVGVDVLGIIVNAYAGDKKSAALDATALLTSSASDVFVSGKGLSEINTLNRELTEQSREMENRLREMERRSAEIEGKRLADEYVNDLIYSDVDPYANGYDLSDPRIDHRTGYPKEAYWEYLRNNDPQKLVNMGIDPNMPVGGWPEQPISTEPTAEDWNKFNRDMADIINNPGYPTAPKDRMPPAKPVDTGPQYSEVPEWLKDQWAEMDERRARQEELNRIQLQILMDQKHEEALRDEKRKEQRAASGIDSMDSFFRNNAFEYESMVGIVATDLTPWLSWLVQQDVDRLERLALQAGYPNLASALADAANLIRNAEDEGFRRWANTAPSCAGIAGCGPQYLERWAMKKSQVALGDILADSRDIFSTAGLSDIKISGFLLSYIMRDYSLEDGDIVDVIITQFGRKIFETQISLLNAGTDFNINLQPGVAAIEITAVNEGYSSPNTAAITIANVTEGASEQTYSLRTGETATLRVEPGQ
ncbi:hypothetical protein FF098_009110 [Parvularcula flava]|nr:hypothetical protein [Aquisalinus luteolus]NHK28062.1 hypothetical protein [Aquisalinus luteolus]